MTGLSTEHRVYLFDDFSIDVDSRTLAENGIEVHLAHRPFDILVELIENSERVISRKELLDKFWDGQYVYDDALRKSVSAVRKALKDTRKPARFIETRYGGGFRFVGDVKAVEKNGNGSSNGFVAQRAVRKPGPRSRLIAITAGLALLIVAGLTIGFNAFSAGSQTDASAKDSQSNGLIRSIVILPIKNVSGDASNDYFSEGVTESLITQLSRSKDLRVISTRSILSQKGIDDLAGMGQRLGADAFLEGSLQKRGENINVRVRLVSVSDGSVIWTSNDFERSMASAFDLQDAIACDISAELKSEMCLDGGNGTKVGLAYQEYLKGRYEWNKRTAAGIKRSIEHYKVAIQFDPKYSLAYAGLADSYVQGVWYDPVLTSTAIPQALAAATTAIELDGNSAEAHTAMASSYQLAWRWDEAGRALQKAIELNPKYARAYHVNAYHLSSMGYYDEALASIRRAHEIDPLNLVVRADTAMIMLHAREVDPARVDAALQQCRELAAAYPEYAETYTYLALIGWIKGDKTLFFDNYIESKRRNGATAAAIASYQQAFRSGGEKALFRRELAQIRSQVGPKANVPTIWVSALYAVLGEKENALKWLERSFEARSPNFIGAKPHPYFDPIRSEPRFQELMRRAGL